MTKNLLFALLLGTALLIPSFVHADLTFVSDQTSFQSSVSGMLFLGTEDFEEVDSNALPINSSTGMAMDGPLTQTSTNSPYPTGINMPITVQANSLGANPTTPSPRGAGGEGLTVQRQGFRSSGNFLFRFTSTIVLANSGADGIDYLFQASDNIRAVSMFPKALDPLDAVVTIRVYDTANVLLGSTSVTTNSGHVLESGVDRSLNPFLGITSSTAAIGRINLYGVRFNGATSVSEGADDISLYSAIPEPGAIGLLAASGIFLVVRRRR